MGDGVGRLLKKGILGFLVVILVAVGISMLVRQFGDFEPDRTLVQAGQTDLGGARSEGGADFDLFVPPERVPTDFRSEVEAPPLALIPERQQKPLPARAVSPEDKAELGEVASSFLSAWETFAPGDDVSAYQGRFAAFAVPSAIVSMARRFDSHQYSGIGLCASCTTGSRPADAIDPRYYVVVRRIDDESAYITTQMVVGYSGTGSPWNGQLYRRSYALIMERSGDGWLVRRVAAETLDRFS